MCYEGQQEVLINTITFHFAPFRSSSRAFVIGYEPNDAGPKRRPHGRELLHVRMALARKDLLKHVELKSEQAVQRDDPKWKVEDMKALAVLVKMLSPSYQSMVRECKTAHEAWETLKNFFFKRNLHNRVQLRKQLHEFSMESGANLMKHMLNFNELCLKLSAAGANVSEDEKMAILLGSLSSDRRRRRSRQLHNEVVVEATMDGDEAEVEVAIAGTVEGAVTSLESVLSADRTVTSNWIAL
ncbi:unnamed protein product [Phytophthora lilii]|uniref:Unnamed protein product n=1 Tax=Phytophthora lilii TaxID=2077276 RepID=A0A9W6UBF3_9STRA|nr:unnamed protein product [Phytophthora lilii]